MSEGRMVEWLLRYRVTGVVDCEVATTWSMGGVVG